MLSLKDELTMRGLLYQTTNEELFAKYDKWGETFYCGFDPTADSLHLGNFIGFMVAIHFMRRWNNYIALTWGATGMIGDPGWKEDERQFLDNKALRNNQNAIANQIWNILDKLKTFTKNNLKYSFVNNKDFYKGVWYLDFLRDIWKYITINVMMSKDTVKNRINDPKKSISYTEFSYMLLQWNDYCHMFDTMDVRLQIWWQDQWWNLVTGTELIRKKFNKEAYALTWPLITDSSWKKFGKSEWNAIWLDKNKTSSYEIYQYFMNISDNDIDRYLKMLTLIDLDEIDEIIKQHNNKPEDRNWQKKLAYSIVEIIHWTNEADFALKISDFMFSWDKLDILKWLDNKQINSFIQSIWWISYTDQNLFELIVSSGLASSNSQARQAISSGSIYINENKITDFKYDFSNDFLDNNVLLLQKGKKNLRIINK